MLCVAAAAVALAAAALAVATVALTTAAIALTAAADAAFDRSKPEGRWLVDGADHR